MLIVALVTYMNENITPFTSFQADTFTYIEFTRVYEASPRTL